MALGFRTRSEHSLCRKVDDQICRSVIAQNKPRQEWTTTETPEELQRRICVEMEELEEAVDHCSFLGADPYALASEIGDVFYLAIKLEAKMGRKPLPQKTGACLLRAVEIAELCGLSINDCVTYKLWRNDYKYPLVPATEAVSYDRPNEISKKMYKDMGGEEAFNFAYMMNGEDIALGGNFESSFLQNLLLRLKNLRSSPSTSTVR